MEKVDNAAGLSKGLEESLKEGYLGNADIVESVIRGWAGEILDADTQEEAMAACDRMGVIFSGGDPAFTMIPGWNDREHLGMMVSRRAGIDPNHTLIDILRGAFIGNGAQLRELLNENDGKPYEEWGWQVDGIVEFLQAMMMGTADVLFPVDPEAE